MYEVIIKRKGTVVKKMGKVWETIDQVPECDGSDKLKNVYGYTPEIDKTVEYEMEILKQTVEELDLAEVIKAINKL